MTEKKLIRYDDPDAAKFVTDIKGWVDRTGRFFGDGPDAEHGARFSSADILICEGCGQDYPNHSYCRPCEDKKARERYEAMPKKKWDGEGAVCSDAADEFFFSWDEVTEHCENEECSLESLRLVICEPEYAYEIDGTDYYQDILPEDMTLDDCDSTLDELIEEMNTYIRVVKPILSWTPGKFRVDLEAISSND